MKKYIFLGTTLLVLNSCVKQPDQPNKTPDQVTSSFKTKDCECKFTLKVNPKTSLKDYSLIKNTSGLN